MLSQHVRPVENHIELKAKVLRKESSSGPMRKKSIASVSSSENGMSSLTLDKLGMRGRSKFAEEEAEFSKDITSQNEEGFASDLPAGGSIDSVNTIEVEVKKASPERLRPPRRNKSHHLIRRSGTNEAKAWKKNS